ncbi:PadR family transcriptional regulator [Paenibacillaceae bacterium]|nr:PadR family transcriptional regulator [Paenibacillaceae bacterium]
MARNQNKLEKDETLGHVVKVQQVIDFFVLSELQKGRRYQGELEQAIISQLSNVGVSKGYLTTRLQKLAAEGHVLRSWENDDRYNRFYEITDEGLIYFKKMLQELPDRVKLAQKVYQQFEDYIRRFDSMNFG